MLARFQIIFLLVHIYLFACVWLVCQTRPSSRKPSGGQRMEGKVGPEQFYDTHIVGCACKRPRLKGGKEKEVEVVVKMGRIHSCYGSIYAVPPPLLV